MKSFLYRSLVVVLLLVTALPVGVSRGEATPESDAPIPVELPRDDGPHDALIEWWYYTGHLTVENGTRYGFEYVVFKGNTGELLGYVSHFAITDSANGVFAYDQRLRLGEQATPQPETGFDFTVGEWSMAGSDGNDRLFAEMEGFAIDLTLVSTKPAVLHDGDGYIDYGSGEASYYYSRTRMDVSGTIIVGDETIQVVSGEAWFDHQWGDFTTFQDGGWDWFSLQLDDQTELMLYVITTVDGTTLIVDGSIVDADGGLTVLSDGDFLITPLDEWTSPHTGVTYPSGWEVTIPSIDLVLTVTPTLLDQELDTRATTGVIYWEGEVIVTGTRAGKAIGGLGYVELTGYAARSGVEG